MRQSRKNIDLKVGVFVLFGIVLLCSYIALLGHNNTLLKLTSDYKVKLPESHGLFAGSTVTINGVSAGNISSLEFRKETGEVDVTLTILNKYTHFITDKTIATSITKGVLGDKFISLSVKGTGTILPIGSYIASNQSPGLMQLFNDPSETKKISLIIDEILTLLQLLNSSDGPVQSVSAFLSLNKSKNAGEILKKLNSILEKIDKGQGTAGALINNRSIYTRILSLLGQKPYKKYLPSLVKESKPEK